MELHSRAEGELPARGEELPAREEGGGMVLFYRGGGGKDVIGVDLRSTSTAKEEMVAGNLQRSWLMLPQVREGRCEG